VPPDATHTEIRARKRSQLWHIRVLLLLLTALAILVTLRLARDLLIPIALAILFATLLAPAVNRLRKWHVPNVLAAGLVMVLVVGSMAAVIDVTVDPAREWLNRAPGILRDVERKIGPLQRVAKQIDTVALHAERVAEGTAAQRTAAQEPVPAAPAPARKMALIWQTPAMMIKVVGTLFLTFFLLAWGPRMLAGFAGGLQHVGADRALTILAAAQHETVQYLGTVSIINMGLGLATTGVAAAFDLPTPWLWGLMAAVFNFIPYAGSAVTLTVLTVVALLTREGVGPAFGVALSYLGLATLEGQLVQPLAVGRRLSLSPLLVFLALWFWGWLWGVAGMILATPMLLAAKAVSCQIPGLERIAQIFGASNGGQLEQVAARWRRKPT
jgi:predicted PurR-regulated permease PerM